MVDSPSLLKGGRFELIYGHFSWWTPFFPLVEASFGRESEDLTGGIIWYFLVCSYYIFHLHAQVLNTILLCLFQWAFRSPIKSSPSVLSDAVRLSDRLAAFRGASGCGACTHIAGAVALDLGAQWGNLPATAAGVADPKNIYMNFWGETSGKSWTESFWPRGFGIVPKTRWLGRRYDPKHCDSTWLWNQTLRNDLSNMGALSVFVQKNWENSKFLKDGFPR